MIRAAVVAQSLAIRIGLRALLSDGQSVEVTAEAASLAELETNLSDIDVLVVAESRPPVGLNDLVESGALPAVLLLSDEARGAQELAVISPHAWGVLPVEATVEELLAAVMALHEGLIVLSPLSRQARRDGQGVATLSSWLGLTEGEAHGMAEQLVEPLTDRERQVLQLLAQGLSNKQIAAALSISEHTVKFHVSAIYGKLGAANRTEAVRLGVQQGLVIL